MLGNLESDDVKLLSYQITILTPVDGLENEEITMLVMPVMLNDQ